MQPVNAVAALCRARGVAVHCDASQSAGKIDVDVQALGVDLLTIAGHKARRARFSFSLSPFPPSLARVAGMLRVRISDSRSLPRCVSVA